MTDYPPPGAADRIRAARTRADLSEPAVSEALGITLAAYYDLESYDEEVFMCLSLEEAHRPVTLRELRRFGPTVRPARRSFLG